MLNSRDLFANYLLINAVWNYRDVFKCWLWHTVECTFFCRRCWSWPRNGRTSGTKRRTSWRFVRQASSLYHLVHRARLWVCVFGVCVEQEETLALRKEGIGVILDSELPHLIGIDDDLLSTGIILYHLKVMNIRQCSSQYERWRERCLYSWMNSFIFYYVGSCSAWLVCVCLQEGRTYVGRDDATNEQDISEFINTTLSLYLFSYGLIVNELGNNNNKHL